MTHPRRSYRCPEDLYQRAKARAKTEGTTVSEIINARLDEYTDGWQPDEELPPLTSLIGSQPGLRAELADDLSRHLAEELQDPAFRDAYENAIRRSEREAAAEVPDPSACTALIGPESKPCPCSGFKEQKVSPNRCGQCGHLKGLHQ